jgi:hypothetical protein
MPGEVFGQTQIQLHHGYLRERKGTEKMGKEHIRTEEINQFQLKLINHPLVSYLWCVVLYMSVCLCFQEKTSHLACIILCLFLCINIHLQVNL